MKWFYSENLSQSQVVLQDDEFRHMVSVMRAREGDSVVCFDGKGTVCECRVSQISKKQAMLQVVSKQVFSQPQTDLVLAAAAIKGERQDTMLRQATELGATKIVLLETDRSEVSLHAQKMDRLTKQLIASCKQCKRAFLPELSFQKLSEFKPQSAIVLVGSFEATVSLAAINSSQIAKNSVTVLVGPEGGFSPEEEKMFSQNGFQKVRLGQNILRADTAAAMLLSYAKCTKEW